MESIKFFKINPLENYITDEVHTNFLPTTVNDRIEFYSKRIQKHGKITRKLKNSNAVASFVSLEELEEYVKFLQISLKELRKLYTQYPIFTLNYKGIWVQEF